MPDKFNWEWAGVLPPKVLEEAKAELSLELAVADALMGNGDYGPEVEKLAKEKMNRAIKGEPGAAHDYLTKTLAETLGLSLGDGDEKESLKEPPVAREPGPAGAG